MKPREILNEDKFNELFNYQIRTYPSVNEQSDLLGAKSAFGNLISQGEQCLIFTESLRDNQTKRNYTRVRFFTYPFEKDNLINEFVVLQDNRIPVLSRKSQQQKNVENGSEPITELVKLFNYRNPDYILYCEKDNSDYKFYVNTNFYYYVRVGRLNKNFDSYYELVELIENMLIK